MIQPSSHRHTHTASHTSSTTVLDRDSLLTYFIWTSYVTDLPRMERLCSRQGGHSGAGIVTSMGSFGPLGAPVILHTLGHLCSASFPGYIYSIIYYCMK